jgi:hypothetical protein
MDMTIDQNTISLENLHKLFDVMYYMVWLSGGDGDAAVISGKYVALADLFEKYSNSQEWGYERDNQENVISFSSGMDSITFYKDEKAVSTNPLYPDLPVADFIVQIIDYLF